MSERFYFRESVDARIGPRDDINTEGALTYTVEPLISTQMAGVHMLLPWVTPSFYFHSA